MRYWSANTYIDDFSELHTKDLFARENLGGVVPNTLDSELMPPERETTIVGNLQSSPDTVRHWPLMNHKKSHFMHWLEQARKQDLFSPDWLEKVKVAFIELYHEANSLRYRFQEGHLDASGAGIADLEQQFARIDALLNDYD